MGRWELGIAVRCLVFVFRLMEYWYRRPLFTRYEIDSSEELKSPGVVVGKWNKIGTSRRSFWNLSAVFFDCFRFFFCF